MSIIKQMRNALENPQSIFLRETSEEAGFFKG